VVGHVKSALVATIADGEHERAALAIYFRDGAAGDRRLERRPGLLQEILFRLLVVHDDRRREVLHGHAGIADWPIWLAEDCLSPLPVADLLRRLQVPPDAALLCAGDESVAEDARVPAALDGQAMSTRELIAELPQPFL